MFRVGFIHLRREIAQGKQIPCGVSLQLCFFGRRRRSGSAHSKPAIGPSIRPRKPSFFCFDRHRPGLFCQEKPDELLRVAEEQPLGMRKRGEKNSTKMEISRVWTMKMTYMSSLTWRSKGFFENPSLLDLQLWLFLLVPCWGWPRSGESEAGRSAPKIRRFWRHKMSIYWCISCLVVLTHDSVLAGAHFLVSNLRSQPLSWDGLGFLRWLLVKTKAPFRRWLFSFGSIFEGFFGVH